MGRKGLPDSGRFIYGWASGLPILGLWPFWPARGGDEAGGTGPLPGFPYLAGRAVLAHGLGVWPRHGLLFGPGQLGPGQNRGLRAGLAGPSFMPNFTSPEGIRTGERQLSLALRLRFC
jgi:hypothetical protein